MRILVETSGTIAESEFAAIKAAGYTDAQLVDVGLAIARVIFTNTFDRVDDTAIDFPPVQ